MRPEDLTKMKQNLSKKKKAPRSEGTSKKSVVHQEEVANDRASAVETTVVLATPTPSSSSLLTAAPIFVVASVPMSLPPVAPTLISLASPHEVRV